MSKVSLVVPVYGVEKYIDKFLESIRKQTFQDLEVILVDDGSPDNCPAILDAFAATDDRYHVIHQKNGGVSAARNTGLSAATGEYVYIVDSDDWLTDNAIEQLWNEAVRTDADVVYGDWVMEQENDKPSVVMRSFPKPFVTDNAQTIDAIRFALNSNGHVITIPTPEFSQIDHLGGAPWRCLFRLSLIKENGLQYDPYVRGLGDDILFSLHVYEYVKKVAYIQVPIYHYRIVEVSFSHGYKANYIETITRIFERQEAFLNDYRKGDMAWKSYYTRVIFYLQEGMTRYFLSSGNPKTESDRFAEFKSLMKTEPYASAAAKAPIEYIGNKNTRYAIRLLRMHLYKLYWVLKKHKG